MGIAAIFKRPKATTSSGTLNDSEVSANRTCQAKRSSAPSGDIKQRSESKKGVSRSTSSAAKRRHRTAAQPIDDCEDLPTPDNSVSESNNIRAQNSALPQPNQQPNQQPLDNLGLSLYSIRTPPPDLLAHQMKELDPFADSPPPPALTNFEDPVYIPPLTLTETLAYEYTAPSQPATQPTTAVRATASASYGGSFGSSKPALSPTGNTASGGMDLLSEFNATYNYLFGTLPPDTVATPHNVSALADGQFSTATNSGPTALSCQTKYNSGSAAPALSGLLSPVSDKSGKSNTKHTQRGAGKANARCDSDYASSVDEKTGTSVSDRDSSEGDSESMSSEAQRDEERRREDEERRAVEQRNRRREQLKQQVAFERMKERHRRQVVSPTSGPKSIARWQQDASMNATIGNGLGSGNDTFTTAQSAFAQDTLHASYGTINRGYVAGAIHHSVSNQGYVASGGGLVANALYSNAQANASMPNVGTNLHDTQFAANQTPAHGTPMSPQRLPAMDPFAAATCARMTGQQIQQVNGIYYMMPGQPGSVPGPMLPPQAAAPLSTIPTQPEAPSYPVKLAMETKKQSNPYLSDSSEDDDNDASSLNDSESNDSSVTGNLDYEYAASPPVGFDKASSQPTHPAPLVTNKSESGSSSSDLGVITVSRTGSQPMLADDDRTVVRDSGTSDASSDLSNNSQSSSKRQVRFNETVSVVFNTRNSITEDDLDSKSAQIIGYESDNSSNASVEFAMAAASRPATGHGMATKSSLKKPALDVAKFANDDAFDAGNAYSSLRYQMPIDISPHAAAYWDLGDTATALNSSRSSQKSSAASSRDISPTRSRSRKPRHKKKHRIEMQPLRDREAEREEELKKESRSVTLHAVAPTQPGPPSADSLRSGPSQQSMQHRQTANDAAYPAVTADTMLEARRALIGHYTAPNQHMPLGSNIPRSNNLPTSRPHASQGVKVIKPQSFARPKSIPANVPAKAPQTRAAARPKEPKSGTQQCASTGDQAKEPTQQATKSRMEGGNKDPQSESRRDLDGFAQELDSSQEFSFGNVIQNFSLTSFEITTGKQGGMYIHYSDRNSSTNNITGTGQGNESDGDDIPLASIIRSKSEPSVYPARHSVDAHLARLNANGDEQSRTYDSDNHNSAAAAADLYQPRRFLSRRPRAADKDSKVNNQVTKFENIRSFSMDNGSRPLKKPVSAAATQAPPKRKFRKWGGIF